MEDPVFFCKSIPGTWYCSQALGAADGSVRYARSQGRMERSRRSKQLGANRPLANVKSSMFHPGKQPVRRMHLRMYIPQVGYLFSYFDHKYERESSAMHITAKTMKKKPRKNQKDKKIPVPPGIICFRLIGTPCADKRKKSKSKLLLASCAARPSRDHLTTDSVWVTLSSLSAPVSRVARLA